MMASSECSAATTTAQTSASTWLTPVEIGMLGGIWGGSFLFMRVAAPDFGPFALVEMRLALGALVLLPFLWRMRFTRQMWLRLAVIGAVNSAIPFCLFAWGAERAPAGIGAITNSMSVPFSALVAVLFYGDRIGVRRVAGLLLGFAGVLVLASGKMSGSNVGLAVVAGTLAALCYGFGGNMARHSLAGIPPSAVAAATMLSSSVLLLPFAIASWPAHPAPLQAWVSALLLGVLSTGFAYVVYYRLINRIGAPRAATVTYIVPLTGVLWAWIFLGEPLTATMAVSGILILSGVALSQNRPRNT